MSSWNDTKEAPSWQDLEHLESGDRAMLAESGISPAVAQARGYQSIANGDHLRGLGFSNDQARLASGLLIPVWSRHGIDHYQLRPYSPRRDSKGKTIKYETPPTTTPVIDAHPFTKERVTDASVDLWITEGVKKADSAISHGLCCVALSGVWLWGQRNAETGRFELLSDFEAIPLEARTVYVCFDSDVMTKAQVAKALKALRKALVARGAIVKLVYLPDAEDGSKLGLDDYLASGKTTDDLYALATDELRTQRARLVVSANVAEMVGQAWDAIAEANEPVRLVSYGGNPTRLTRTETGADLTLISQDMMMLEVSRAIDTVSVRMQGRGEQAHEVETSIQPPKALVAGLLASEVMPLPELVRIVTAPVVASDNTLQTAPGYSAKTKTYYTPAKGFVVPSVPERPSASEVKAAVARIDHMIADFPLADEASRAHAFAMALLPLVRGAIDGPTPGHLVSAPKIGSGKDKLVRTLLYPALGSDPVEMREATDDAEWGKRFTSTLLPSPMAVSITNVTRPLKSGQVASALSSRVWRNRILGLSQDAELPIQCVWAITANNPILSDEVARRIVEIRLDPQLEQPWLRPLEGFRIPNLDQWVADHRAELVAALLTLVRHWYAQGAPKGQATLGSFDAWAGVLGGILESAGVGGFLGNLQNLYQTVDSETEAWRGFVELWWMVYQDKPTKIKDLYGLLDGYDGLEVDSIKALGNQLNRQRDATIGKYRVKPATASAGYRRWRLERTERESDTERKTRENAHAEWVKEQSSGLFNGKRAG